MTQPTSYDPSPRAHPGLHVIALIELAKGLVSASAAITLALVGPSPIRASIAAIGERLHFDTRHSALARFIEGITPETVHLAAAAIGIYALLRFLLFWGLWRVKAWASWLGACAAVLYVPFCSFALWRYPGWPTAAVLTLNLVIVWVLVRDLLRRRAARKAGMSNR
ncbi:MAG: DUF2127 domain-containing protein [Pseudomonadota bacterium]